MGEGAPALRWKRTPNVDSAARDRVRQVKMNGVEGLRYAEGPGYYRRNCQSNNAPTYLVIIITWRALKKTYMTSTWMA